MIEKHPDWIIVEQLEALGSQDNFPYKMLCLNSSALIRRLKRELNKAQDDASRLRYPDTTGQ